MPVKNGALYLKECINSIICQDFINWELIVVNDHSTDNSLQILHYYAHLDSRIKILENNNSGIISALQTGYKFVTGNFITRMDADDIMPLNKLRILHDKLVWKGVGFIATGLVQYFADYPLGDGYKKYEKWLNQLCSNNSHFNEIYKECVIPSPCWMVWKSDFDQCGGFEVNRYPEDYDLAFRFYKQGLEVVSSNEVLHHWRDYSNRTSRTDENYKDNRFLELKTDYFIELDLNNKQELFLWGAGKKAKFIARKLIEKGIHFRWLSNNTKKIGLHIYDIIIEPQNHLEHNVQVIIAVANPNEKREIQDMINKKDAIDTYFFS